VLYFQEVLRMNFAKPALTVAQQVTKLCDRGLGVEDSAEAEHYLRHIGYYRLSAYALPLQQGGIPDKPFKPGASFRNILNLYRFDRELRLLVMDAVERIEVAVRSVIVNEMSVRHGPHWFMDAAHFNPASRRFRHHELLNRIDREFSIPAGGSNPARPHHEVFINHYFNKYTSPYLPPAWMVAETLTLGTWSQIFENLRVTAERKAIASHFGVDEQILRNWLHALTYLRNLCAYHSRLWNRQTVIKIAIANKHKSFLGVNDRFYAFAVVINDLIQRIAPHTGWHHRLEKLMTGHPFVAPNAMGFPSNWREESFWNFDSEGYCI
jgi:abortive infection bacteriophage resistance protein